MKKIIATVLAMVMALALCTVAFADSVKYTGYENNGKKIENATFTIEAKDAKYDDEKHGQKDNNVAYYLVTNSNTPDNHGAYLKADSSDYDLKLTADGKADLYLKDAKDTGVNYFAVATEYTNLGKSCGQLNEDKSGTYYKATWTDDDKTVTSYYAKSSTQTGWVLLVDGKLVNVQVEGDSAKTLKLVGHDWKAASYDKDDNITSYKCKKCGTVAKTFKTYDAAAAAGTATPEQKGDLWLGYTDGKTTDNTNTNGNTSPKTFDAGIAMYVGMALTSVAGSAVVIGKKKEF